MMTYGHQHAEGPLRWVQERADPDELWHLSFGLMTECGKTWHNGPERDPLVMYEARKAGEDPLLCADCRTVVISELGLADAVLDVEDPR